MKSVRDHILTKTQLWYIDGINPTLMSRFLELN